MVYLLFSAGVRKFPLVLVYVGYLLTGGPVFADGILDLFMSPADEERIGAEEHPKILREFGGPYEDPILTPYIKSIGQFLVQTSETPYAKFTFTILDTPLVNAFALPGGYIYVTRGILALASSEAEIAGVLAHEIGHVTARHSAGRATNTGIAKLGLILLDVLGGDSSVNKVGEMGALAVIQSYSREDEFEADRLGVKYLSRAGFQPEAMSTFLQKLAAHSSFEAERLGEARNTGIDFFATHPRTLDRVARAIELADIRQVYEPIVAGDLYLNKINGMVYGDSPQQGMQQGQSFVHPVLRFEFEVPEGFAILNGKDKVLGRSRDGAIFQFDADTNLGNNLDYYIKDQWARGEILTPITSQVINGMRAVTALASSSSESGALLWLIAIEYDPRTIYRFVLAIPTNLSKYRKDLIRGIPFSFSRLDKEAAEKIRPNLVKTYRVSEGDTLEKLGGQMQISEFGIERFLIMNGLRFDDKISPGTLVKLIGK